MRRKSDDVPFLAPRSLPRLDIRRRRLPAPVGPPAAGRTGGRATPAPASSVAGGAGRKAGAGDGGRSGGGFALPHRACPGGLEPLSALHARGRAFSLR